MLCIPNFQQIRNLLRNLLGFGRYCIEPGDSQPMCWLSTRHFCNVNKSDVINGRRVHKRTSKMQLGRPITEIGGKEQLNITAYLRLIS